MPSIWYFLSLANRCGGRFSRSRPSHAGSTGFGPPVPAHCSAPEVLPPSTEPSGGTCVNGLCAFSYTATAYKCSKRHFEAQNGRDTWDRDDKLQLLAIVRAQVLNGKMAKLLQPFSHLDACVVHNAVVHKAVFFHQTTAATRVQDKTCSLYPTRETM